MWESVLSFPHVGSRAGCSERPHRPLSFAWVSEVHADMASSGLIPYQRPAHTSCVLVCYGLWSLHTVTLETCQSLHLLGHAAPTHSRCSVYQCPAGSLASCLTAQLCSGQGDMVGAIPKLGDIDKEKRSTGLLRRLSWVTCRVQGHRPSSKRQGQNGLLHFCFWPRALREVAVASRLLWPLGCNR